MLKPKKKITRQELKEDKFVKTALEVKTFIDENYKQVTMVVGGVFAVVALLILFVWVQGLKKEEASAQLGIAQIEYNNLNYSKAKTRLLRLIEEYGGTEYASQGKFLLANIYYQQKELEPALQYFEEFVDEYSGSDVLIASGYAGMAAIHEKKGEYTTAAEYYEKAAEEAPDFPESDNFIYLAGLCYKKAGEMEKAKEKFEKLVESHNTEDRLADAESQLIMLQKHM